MELVGLCACFCERNCVGLIFEKGFLRHIFTPGVRNKKATFLIPTTSLLLAANHIITCPLLSISPSVFSKIFLFVLLFYLPSVKCFSLCFSFYFMPVCPSVFSIFTCDYLSAHLFLFLFFTSVFCLSVGLIFANFSSSNSLYS